MSTWSARNTALWSGAAGPSLDLQFTTGALDPRITFTRAAGPATYFDSTGALQTAGTDVPRFDYDPATLQPRGLLIEEARTNLALQSGTPASWTAAAATIVAAATTAPDGTLTGALLREDSTNTVHAGTPGQTILTATVYTVSFFAKASTRTFVGINGAGLGAAGLTASFNLSTGTDVTTGSNAAFFHGIIPCANGWYRCWVTWTTSTTTGFNVEPHNLAANRSYLGDGVSGVFVWGAQVEAGAFLTSHIPTTGATATRAQDAASMLPGAWFSATQGSWAADFIVNGALGSASPRIIGGNPGVFGPLFYNGATSFTAGTFDKVAAIPTVNTAAVNTVAKAASSWAANVGKVCLNGGAVASGAQTGGYSTMTPIWLGGDNTPADTMTGTLRRIRFWPRALSAAELQSVTR